MFEEAEEGNVGVEGIDSDLDKGVAGDTGVESSEDLRQHAVDRGDFIEGDDVFLEDGSDAGEDGKDQDAKDKQVDGDEDGTNKVGDGKAKGDDLGDGSGDRGEGGDLDADMLASVAALHGGDESGKQNGMPFSRANAIAREKNAALDLSTAIINGVVDKRWIEDMGGVNVIAKGMVSGEIVLPGAQSGETGTAQGVHPEIAGLETKLDDLNGKLADATIDANQEEIKRLNKEINSVNRQLFRTETRIEQETATEQARLSAAEQDKATVEQVMVDLWGKHPALHSDTNEYIAFMARRDTYLRNGKLMSEALKLAEKETFPSDDSGTGDAGSGKATERQIAAREKGARASAAQPSAGKAGAGVRSNKAPRGVEALSDDEFDNMSEEDKAKARGDVV